MNETLMNIPWKLLAPVLALQLLLTVAALISLARAEETNGPKWMWVPIILLGSIIGSIAYFLFGRRNT